MLQKDFLPYKTGIIQMKNSDSISENQSYIKTESKKLKKEGSQLIILQELQHSLNTHSQQTKCFFFLSSLWDASNIQ